MSRSFISQLLTSRARSIALVPLVVACFGLLDACGSSSSTTNTTANAAAKNTGSAAATTTTGGAAGATGSGSTAGSSTASGASGSTATKTSTAPGSSPGGSRSGAGQSLEGRFAAMRECMSRNGIVLPQRPSLGAFTAPQLPKGTTRARYAELLRQCGAGAGLAAGARAGGSKGRLASPAFRQALAAFATCLRQNGVKVPAPNTSGHGPIFDIKGIDTASPQFRAARRKCSATLVTALRATRPAR